MQSIHEWTNSSLNCKIDEDQHEQILNQLIDNKLVCWEMYFDRELIRLALGGSSRYNKYAGVLLISPEFWRAYIGEFNRRKAKDNLQFEPRWHTPDFATVMVSGTTYILNSPQAVIIKIMHDFHMQGYASLAQPSIIDRLGEQIKSNRNSSNRISESFKNNRKAEKALIIKDKNNVYRLPFKMPLSCCPKK